MSIGQWLRLIAALVLGLAFVVALVWLVLDRDYGAAATLVIWPTVPVMFVGWRE